MKKFPKPKCDALVALQLEQVKEQMQQRGKHPHFRFEKSLYKVQIFDMHMGRSQQTGISLSRGYLVVNPAGTSAGGQCATCHHSRKTKDRLGSHQS